jgi:hypothetical protein
MDAWWLCIAEARDCEAIARECWGGWIRTTDYLIQSQVTKTSRALTSSGGNSENAWSGAASGAENQVSFPKKGNPGDLVVVTTIGLKNHEDQRLTNVLGNSRLIPEIRLRNTIVYAVNSLESAAGRPRSCDETLLGQFAPEPSRSRSNCRFAASSLSTSSPLSRVMKTSLRLPMPPKSTCLSSAVSSPPPASLSAISGWAGAYRTPCGRIAP